jgi:hypothetical protein
MRAMAAIARLPPYKSQGRGHMGSWTRRARAALIMGIAASAVPAYAQRMYRCNGGNSSYLSDRPCTTGAGQMLGSYGNVSGQSPPLPGTVLPPVQKAPEHLQYLSAECAALNDAIRTGPARGVRSGVLSELRDEYARKCSDDDRAAREQVSRDKWRENEQRRREQAAQQAARTQVQVSREQCAELLRIVHAKRKQLDAMTPGEKADLQRAETNYNARCIAS